jgi:hypothetical protein
MVGQRETTLALAEEIAGKLGELETLSAHRLRAFYFDYIGDDVRAVAEWQRIQDTQVLFLVLTLFHQGRFDDAIAACDHLNNGKPDRMMDFVRALVLSATSDSPAVFGREFPLQAETQLSPIHELLTVYTAASLSGQPEVAQREAARLKDQKRLPEFLRRWYGRIEEFTSGEISGQQLLEHAGPSRKKQCEGHYYIGVNRLCAGDRAAALSHFQASAATRVFNFYEHHMSRSLAAQLHRQPDWPNWID